MGGLIREAPRFGKNMMTVRPFFADAVSNQKF
jgi:hypothetical protein